MENKMFQKVNELLEKYIGGQIFFSELDNAVKFDEEILTQLLTKANAIKSAYPNPQDILTIASGEIGLSLHNLGIPVDFLVKGGLRHNPNDINLKPFADKIKNKSFIFINDSYFSGKTLQVVKEEIERLGGKVIFSMVAYDGSRVKDNFVYSLYRYYDHYDILGRPLKKD